MLVNTTRALKSLESYGDRQTQLWKVLTKYDQLPDHFHDLKNHLETEFQYLKEATSCNIDNLQCAVNLQQTYTTTLCANVNNIYSKLAQLEAQIQMHCIYPHLPADTVQLEAPDYDFDKDGPQAENNPTTTRVTVSVQGLSSSSETLSNAKETEDSNSLGNPKIPNFKRILIGLSINPNTLRIYQNKLFMQKLQQEPKPISKTKTSP